MKQAIIIDFIPILIIFLFLCYTNISIQFANTVLGRFIAIAVIVYYTSIDYLYGLIACLIVVFFYQSMFIEGLKNMENFENMNYKTEFDVSGNVLGNDINDNKAYKNDEQNLEAFEDYPSEYKYLSGEKENVYNHFNKDHINILYSGGTPEGRSNGESGKGDAAFGGSAFSQKDTFVKNNCRNGQLFHKEYNVKKEMTEFVYPNINFEDDTCNVCDPNCKFSIIEQKIQTEDLMMKPVDSNDWYNDAMVKINGVISLPTPAIQVSSDPYCPLCQ